MDGGPAGAFQTPLSIDEAKRRLLEESPLPAAEIMKDPLEWVRRHPRESIAVAAAIGMLLGAAPRLRRNLLSVAVDAAKVLLK